MRAIYSLAMVGIAACQVDHNITLLLGPTSDTLTAGFTCPDPALLGRGYDSTTKVLSFNLVVDVIDLGNSLPSCFGEDLEVECSHGACRLLVSEAPQRICVAIAVPDVLASDPAAVPQQIRKQLAQLPSVVSQAPHRPVIMRAVATLQDCAAVELAQGEVWPTLDPTMALGCAYSCPVNLDDVQDSIVLGLNVPNGTTAATCQSEVRACTAFPDSAL